MTKTIVAAAAIAAFMGTAASAADLAYGVTAGATATTEFNIDTEVLTFEVEPTVGYMVEPVGVQLTAATTLTIYEDDFVDATFEELPTIDFTAERAIMGNGTVYAEMSYDLEAGARSDAVLGVSFSF